MMQTLEPITRPDPATEDRAAAVMRAAGTRLAAGPTDIDLVLNVLFSEALS